MKVAGIMITEVRITVEEADMTGVETTGITPTEDSITVTGANIMIEDNITIIGDKQIMPRMTVAVTEISSITVMSIRDTKTLIV